MNWPYEWQIGWRYTRAGRAGRRNGFISFISGVSMLGIALGVAALIIVLSVMNGFQKEVRDRMLSVIAHIEVFDAAGGALADWHATAAEARKNPQVQGAAPWDSTTSMCATIDSMRSRTSFWKPFITDSTMISAATPSAMPNTDTPEMNEMKPLRRPPRPARV